MIGKLVNGYPVPCPKQGRDGQGHLHTNLQTYYEKHLDKAAIDGYYPVVYTEKPEGYYIDSWSLQLYEGVQSIVQIWTEYTPEPEPVDPVAERLDMIEECILEMSEIIYA